MTVAFGTYDPSGARAEGSEMPPPVQVRDEGYTVTNNRPPELLPKERGPAHDKLFDPTQIGLTLPDADVLGALQVPNVLPTLSLEPPVDFERLTGDLGAMLPELDLDRLQEPVTGLLGTVGEVVDHLQTTATAVASGVHSASTRQQSAAAEDEPVTFRLTTTASGVTQTFTMTLCTPTPINITSTSQLTHTTVVSLCPVPMALTTTVMTPPPGQPFQLYLSAQRIAGTAAVAASIAASYDVPNASGAPLEVRFGYDSGGNAYPANAIVGAATDYNPFTNSAAEHLTMGWATDGNVASLTVEAVGVGRVQVSANPVPADSGSLALSYVNGAFNAQMTRNAAPLPGSSPRVSITAPVPRASGSTIADLAWTQVSQDFTFSLEPELVDGRPTGVEFSGSQTRGANGQFGLDIDYITDGVLSARLQQTRFGNQFAESVRTTQDEDGNPVGVRVEASPGALSTLVLSVYKGGALGAVVELVDIPSTSSTFSFDMKGTGAASQGATVSGTNAPAFIGAMSFFTALLGGTVVPTPQISAMFETGASLTAAPPVAITPGAQVAVSVARVNPSFLIEIESLTATTGNATGVTGFKALGETTGSTTADQLLIEAQADPWTRVRVLMNALGQEWLFRANLHGTLAAPTGLDVHDENTPAMPAEFKQIHVTQQVSGVYQPLYTFGIQRSGSNTSGAAAAAPKSATVFNPPRTVFDLSLDYVTNTAGNVCTQNLKLLGTSAEETNGYITLAGGDMLLTADRVFVTGTWHVTGDTLGPSTACDVDVFKFTMQQDVGGNPAGVISASQVGKGRVTLRSFATESWVKVEVIRDALRTPTGARVDGGNSEANPGQQILLEQRSGSTTTMALNMWAGSAGTVVNGTQGTVVVNNVPPTFGLSANLVKNPGRNIVRVTSYNQAPAPNESMVVTAPAGNLSPGGTVRFVLRSFDVGTDVQVDAPDESLNSGHFLVRVHNANANPNRTEAVAMDVRNAGGTPVFAALLHRPDANTAGLLTSSANGAFVWSNMPQAFDVTIEADLPPVQQTATRAGLKVEVQHAAVTPESTMLFTQPAQRAMVAVEGLGTAQRFFLQIDRDLDARRAYLHADGTMPDGFRSIQVESLWGDVRDAVFTIYRSGPWRTGWTNRGSNIEVMPSSSQRAFNLTAQMKADEATVQSTADATGQRIHLSQYFYSPSPAVYHHCVWSGDNYPCTAVDLWEMPQAADLTMTSPSPNCAQVKAFPTLKYAGSDSNLRLTVDSLIPCLGGGMAFYGLPAHGVVMDGTLGDMCNAGPQFTLKVTPGFNEVLPYFYIDGWNIKLPMYCSKQYEFAGDPLPPGATIRGFVSTLLNYTAGIAIEGDAGLTEVAVVPVEDKTGEYSGLEGVMAKGNPNAQFDLSMTLGLGPLYDASTGALVPNELSWQWEATGLNFIGVAEDWDRFQWYTPDVDYGTAVWFSSYVWEAFPNNTNRYTFSPGSCGNTGTVTNSHTTLAYSPQIPFQPGFTKVNSGIILCGGRVAYYQMNPQNLVMRHCGETTLWACPGGANTAASNEWSYVDTGWFGYYSDWITAAGMKALYNHDPAALTTRLGTP